MQVVAKRVTCVVGQPDDLPGLNRIADIDERRREVRVDCLVSSGMLDSDVDTVEVGVGVAFHTVDDAIRAGVDIGVGRGANVHALVAGEIETAVVVGICAKRLGYETVVRGPPEGDFGTGLRDRRRDGLGGWHWAGVWRRLRQRRAEALIGSDTLRQDAPQFAGCGDFDDLGPHVGRILPEPRTNITMQGIGIGIANIKNGDGL
jgi:hypothetical protein